MDSVISKRVLIRSRWRSESVADGTVEANAKQREERAMNEEMQAASRS